MDKDIKGRTPKIPPGDVANNNCRKPNDDQQMGAL